MLRLLKRFLAFLGLSSSDEALLMHLGRITGAIGPHPPEAERDPYAWRPVPRTPKPKTRSGAVAVAEPDE